MILGIVAYDEFALKDFMVSNLVLFNSVVVTLVSPTYGVRKGFSLMLPILVAVAYLPYVASIYLTTKSSGIEVHSPIYGMLSFLAVSLGTGIRWLWKKFES